MYTYNVRGSLNVKCEVYVLVKFSSACLLAFLIRENSTATDWTAGVLFFWGARNVSALTPREL